MRCGGGSHSWPQCCKENGKDQSHHRTTSQPPACKLCRQLPPLLLGRPWATLVTDQAPSGSSPPRVHEVVQGTAALAALEGKGSSRPAFILSKFWGLPDFPGVAERLRQQETQQNSVPHLEHNVPQKPPRQGRPGRTGRGRPQPAASDRQLSCLQNHSSTPLVFQTTPEPRLASATVAEGAGQRLEGTTASVQAASAAPPDPLDSKQNRGENKLVVNLSGAQDPWHSRGLAVQLLPTLL